MKKTFVLLLAIFTLVFAACSNGTTVNTNVDNGNVGSKGPGDGIVFFAEGDQFMECSGELGDTTWTAALAAASNYKGGGFTNWRLPNRGELDLLYKNLEQKGLGGFSRDWYWSSTDDAANKSYAFAQDFYNGQQGNLLKTSLCGVRAIRFYSKDVDTGSTALTIKNESFTEITDVIWQNVSFSNNTFEKSIKSGTSATNVVKPGAGYIFFKRKSNPIVARTNDLVIVEENKEIEFTFTNNTVIVETNNPSNNGTLGTLQSTVVWWDDAEGEMQPYFLKQSFVDYYIYNDTNLLGTNRYYFPPKNGTRSIIVGGTTTALLHLKITLDKPAKLSFWYANKRYSGFTAARFSINGTTEITMNTDVNWSFVTFNLAPGENNLVWEKADGYTASYPYAYYYLSIDDILIYYTE